MNQQMHSQSLDICHVEETTDLAMLVLEKHQQSPEMDIRIAISSNKTLLLPSSSIAWNFGDRYKLEN